MRAPSNDRNLVMAGLGITAPTGIDASNLGRGRALSATSHSANYDRETGHCYQGGPASHAARLRCISI